MILFAVALEGIKPLAIVQAFQAFAMWAPIRGVTLAALGLVAVAYSVTSELALMAGSRGDLAAERLRASETRNIARDRYLEAKTELARLAPSRPALELEALIGTFKPICRTVKGESSCSKPVLLTAELARAKRRAELEGVLATSGAQISSGPAIAAADPGTSAMVTFLAVLGVSASESAVAQWLALIPVLAIEIGSAVAGVLVASLSHPRATTIEAVPVHLLRRIPSATRWQTSS
jgi:hypothetical protein